MNDQGRPASRRSPFLRAQTDNCVRFDAPTRHKFAGNAGDTAARELVALLQRARRPSDIIGRLGGEEFAMLLPETDTAAGLEAAERFCRLIAENPVELDAQVSLGVTASFGIAGLHPAIRAGAQWLACADVPPYEAKRAGRNQCHAVG